MAQSNLTLIYLLKILQDTDKNSPLNATQIDKKMVAEYDGLHITRQMVSKHIDVLREAGYNIVKCNKTNDGWYMESRTFDDAQLKIMTDAIRQSNCLPPKESKDIVKELLRYTSKRGRDKLLSLYIPQAREKAEDKETRKNLDMILEASVRGQQIRFHYTYLDGNMKRRIKYDEKKHAPKEYELNVYTLQWAGEIYYVIGGHDHHRPDLTTYRLDRMRDVCISDKKRTAKEDFLVNKDNPDDELQKFINQSVDHFSGEPITLTLEFEQKPMQMDILKDFAGKSLRIIKMENGKVRANVRKYKSPTLTGWLMEYADLFEVIEPQEIRYELEEKAARIAEKYKK